MPKIDAKNIAGIDGIKRMSKRDIIRLIKTLKNNTVYAVQVKCSMHNIEHQVILFVGFADACTYTYVYRESYEYPIDIFDLWSIRIEKELITLEP